MHGSFPTPVSLPGCYCDISSGNWLQTWILCFSFQFAWSGEPFFRSDKYMLAAPRYFLAPGILQAPGNTGGFGGWRSSAAQTGFLLESEPGGGMPMARASGLPRLCSSGETALASITRLICHHFSWLLNCPLEYHNYHLIIAPQQKDCKVVNLSHSHDLVQSCQKVKLPS